MNSSDFLFLWIRLSWSVPYFHRFEWSNIEQRFRHVLFFRIYHVTIVSTQSLLSMTALSSWRRLSSAPPQPQKSVKRQISLYNAINTDKERQQSMSPQKGTLKQRQWHWILPLPLRFISIGERTTLNTSPSFASYTHWSWYMIASKYDFYSLMGCELEINL